MYILGRRTTTTNETNTATTHIYVCKEKRRSKFVILWFSNETTTTTLLIWFCLFHMLLYYSSQYNYKICVAKRSWYATNLSTTSRQRRVTRLVMSVEMYACSRSSYLDINLVGETWTIRKCSIYLIRFVCFWPY